MMMVNVWFMMWLWATAAGNCNRYPDHASRTRYGNGNGNGNEMEQDMKEVGRIRPHHIRQSGPGKVPSLFIALATHGHGLPYADFTVRV
jgi:hypothetical protein